MLKRFSVQVNKDKDKDAASASAAASSAKDKPSASASSAAASKDKRKKDDDPKDSEWEQMLNSGETLLMSLTPNKSDTLDRRTQSIDIPTVAPPRPAFASVEWLSEENKRLEKRVEILNTELFKELSTNAELSDQIKDLLSQIEEYEQMNALGGGDAGSGSAPSSPILETAPVSGDDWKEKYTQLEARSNQLSEKAVTTIHAAKVKMLALQQDNLALSNKARELKIALQKRDEERSKAMNIVPRLVETIRILEAQLEEAHRGGQGQPQPQQQQPQQQQQQSPLPPAVAAAKSPLMKTASLPPPLVQSSSSADLAQDFDELTTLARRK